MATSYDNDAIKGEQLARLAGKIASKIKEKQDIIDAEYDATNHQLVLNNVSIELSE